MSKVTAFLFIIASVCFILCNIKKYDVLKDITDDFDNSTYVYIGCKEYTKENVLKYYLQVFRYICYFIYYIDIKNMETIVIEENSGCIIGSSDIASWY